jgi:hypothetical protein
MFRSVPTSVGAGLRMTIRTQKLKVFETVVVVNTIFMLELKNDFLFVPHQYTITLCEILVLASGTLVRKIKIRQQSFLIEVL